MDRDCFFSCLLAYFGDDESAVTAGSSKSVRATSMLCSIDWFFFPNTERGTRVPDSCLTSTSHSVLCVLCLSVFLVLVC